MLSRFTSVVALFALAVGASRLIPSVLADDANSTTRGAPTSAPATRPSHELAVKLVDAILGHGNPERALKLIEQGADVNAIVGRSTPLYYAAGSPDEVMLEVMKAMFKHGARVDALCIGGGTALFGACSCGGLAKVEFLISEHASVNFKARDGTTPLHVAAVGCSLDQEKVIEFLLAHGANLNAVDGAGMTPLDWAMPWEDNFRHRTAFLKAKGAKSGKELKPATQP